MSRSLALALTVPTLWLVPTTAAHAAGTCQGLPATIESTGGTVTGTEGADVILVTGRADVQALGGNDVICLAGGTADAGDGNDRVTAVGTQTVHLGAGDDVYVGSASPDTVDPSPGDSAGSDTIDAGGGQDQIFSGVSDQPNNDRVSTAGAVTLQIPEGSDASVSGSATVDLDARDAATYAVSVPSTTITRDAAVVARFDASARSFGLAGPLARFTFGGSPEGESLIVSSARSVRAHLGAGPDLVRVGSGTQGAGTIDGGPGRDSFTGIADDAATGDLARQRLRLVNGRGSKAWRLQSFDNVTVAAPTVDVAGSHRAETIAAYGCEVVLRGRAGRDYLVVGTSQRGLPSSKRCDGGQSGQRGRLFGGAGPDTLEGGNGPDVLIGGSGRDRAIGHGGKDRCEAEFTESC